MRPSLGACMHAPTVGACANGMTSRMRLVTGGACAARDNISFFPSMRRPLSIAHTGGPRHVRRHVTAPYPTGADARPSIAARTRSAMRPAV
jgi:hypothetical protein